MIGEHIGLIFGCGQCTYKDILGSYSNSCPVNWSARSHARNGRCEARIEPRLDLSRHPSFQSQQLWGVSWCGRTTKADFAAPHDLVDHPANFFFLTAGQGPPCAFITFDTGGSRLTDTNRESRLLWRTVLVVPEVGEGGSLVRKVRLHKAVLLLPASPAAAGDRSGKGLHAILG
jgi:hypothetical protein